MVHPPDEPPNFETPRGRGYQPRLDAYPLPRVRRRRFHHGLGWQQTSKHHLQRVLGKGEAHARRTFTIQNAAWTVMKQDGDGCAEITFLTIGQS